MNTLYQLLFQSFLQYSTLFDEESKGGIAKWRESDETWFIPKLDLAGNNIKPIRTSTKDAHRPESNYTRQKKKHDPSLRWRQNNVVTLNLDVLDKVSQSYNGPSSESRVTDILNMDIDDEDENIIDTHNSDIPSNNISMHHSQVSISASMKA